MGVRRVLHGLLPKSFWVLAWSVMLILPSSVFPAAASDGPVLSIQFEDDWFAGVDQYYTTGERYALTWSDASTPRFARPVRSLLYSLTPFLGRNPEDDGSGADAFTLAIATQYYTPDSPLSLGIGPYERPYAGWLYLDVIAKDQHLSPDGAVSSEDHIELQAGIVGPRAHSKEIQTWFHRRVIGAPVFVGWDNQIEDEIGVMLLVERRWRLFNLKTSSTFGIDFWPKLGGALGNVRTQVQTGVLTRIGFNLLDTLALGPLSASFQPNSAPQSYDDRWRLYATLGLEARGVARNIFLDGNTFVDSASVDKRLFVHDIYWGIALERGAFSLNYTFVTRSKEFFGQTAPQRYGVVSLTLGL